MNTVKVLSFLKWTLIACFAILICFELFQATTQHQLGLNTVKRVFLLGILILILLFKNKYTWILALMIFIYGMYNTIINSTVASAPTSMEFTQSLEQILNSKGTNDFAHRLVHAFPILFYFLTFLAFATPAVRKWYGFASFKGKSQSAYLR